MQTITFVQQPTDPTAAGAAIAVIVKLEDSHGNLISGKTVTMSLAETGATLGGTLTQTSGPDGIATFGVSNNLNIAKTGTYHLVASANGMSKESNAFNAFTITAGAAVKITPESGAPQTAVVGMAFTSPLKALVADMYGNPVPTLSVTFTAPTGAGAPSATFGGSATATAATDSNGIATSPVMTANTLAGTFSVTASIVGSTAAAAVFTPLENTAGMANKLAFLQQPMSTTAGATINPGSGVTVQLEDQFSNPVRTAGVTITLQLVPVAVRGFRATVFPTQATTAQGVATFSTLSINQHGDASRHTPGDNRFKRHRDVQRSNRGHVSVGCRLGEHVRRQRQLHDQPSDGVGDDLGLLRRRAERAGKRSLWISSASAGDG